MNARLLYIITDLEVGGVPLHLYRLTRAMRDRGFDPTIVSLMTRGPVGDRLRADGFRVLACGGRGGWDFRVIARLGRILRDESPDLVHALLFHANLAARWAAAQVDYPAGRVVCEIQTVEVERRWHLWVDRLSYDGCRFIIGNSPSVIDHLATHARVPRERLRLVRGGIAPEPLQRARPFERTIPGRRAAKLLGPGAAKLQLCGQSQVVRSEPRASARADSPEPEASACANVRLGAGDRLVLWAGRLDPVKGLDVLLDSFAHVAVGHDAHLFLAGDGPLRDELTARTAQLSLDRRVHFLGRRDDVPRWLQTCDVFVFPSRTEGLPNALLEAMAAGCPIVTTDVPGCRDLIAHERTGLLVPQGSARALASAIDRILSDRPLAECLGAAAAVEVRASWHVERTYDAYESAYREVLVHPHRLVQIPFDP